MVSYTTDSGVKKPLSTPTIRIARSRFTNLGSKDTTNYASLQRTRRTPPNIPITTTGLLAPKAGQGRSRTTGTLGSVPDVTTFSKSQLESFGQIGAGLSDTNIGGKIISPLENFAQSLKDKIKNPFERT